MDKESDRRSFECRIETARELVEAKLTTVLMNRLSIRDGIVAELRSELDRLTQSLAAAMAERDGLAVRVDELHCVKADCQTLIEDLRLQLAQRIESSVLDGLVTQLEESQRGNNESRALIKELVATNRGLSTAADRAETAEHMAQVLVREGEGLRMQNDALRKQVECTTAESAALKERLIILEGGAESESGVAIFGYEVQLIREREGHCEVRRRLEGERDELTAQNLELSARIGELDERCSETTLELDKVTSTARRSSSHVDALGVEINQLKKEKETLIGSMDTLKSDHIVQHC